MWTGDGSCSSQAAQVEEPLGPGVVESGDMILRFRTQRKAPPLRPSPRSPPHRVISTDPVSRVFVEALCSPPHPLPVSWFTPHHPCLVQGNVVLPRGPSTPRRGGCLCLSPAAIRQGLRWPSGKDLRSRAWHLVWPCPRHSLACLRSPRPRRHPEYVGWTPCAPVVSMCLVP